MGTIIERVDLAAAHWRNRHSALGLAVAAAKSCLRHAQCPADAIDLLVNVGIYRDRNLGEPALAALIQHHIGANPHDPHSGAHGTFSFDIANGTCGVLTALQIVDGFFRTRVINCAMIVASDANPGFGMSQHFPFSALGSALLCRWTDEDYGLGSVYWSAAGDDGDSFRASVGLHDARNVLRFSESAALDVELARVSARAARSCLSQSTLEPSDVSLIIAAPARRRFRAAMATLLAVPQSRIAVADDPKTHTGALAAAFHDATGRSTGVAPMLFVAGGAGITAGAALYRPAPPEVAGTFHPQ